MQEVHLACSKFLGISNKFLGGDSISQDFPLLQAKLFAILRHLGQGQTSNFSCAEPNANELSSLFHFICIRFST